MVQFVHKNFMQIDDPLITSINQYKKTSKVQTSKVHPKAIYIQYPKKVATNTG